MYSFIFSADSFIEFVLLRVLYALLSPLYLLQALFQGEGEYGPGI